MDHDTNFSETPALIDTYIHDVLSRRITSAADVGESYVHLWQHIEKIVMVGGKRIRPYLTMVGNGRVDERVVPIAAAQELVHAAMLIHDDIIDQDFVRRGQKNIGGIYLDIYGEVLDETRATHYANSAAIMAGDALLSEAYFLVNSSSYDGEVKQKVFNQLHVSIYEVIGGELMDVESGFMQGRQFDPLQIYRYKTSSYSFIGPLLSGAYCAGESQPVIDALNEFATDIGIAFQIQDDLLGVFGEESTTGKSTLTDIHEGKQTVLVKYHRELMNEEQRTRFDTTFGQPQAEDVAVSQLKQDMEDSGAREKTSVLTASYFEKARTALTSLPDDARKSELQMFTDQLERRRG